MVSKGVVGLLIVLVALPALAADDARMASMLHAIGKHLYRQGDAAQAGTLFAASSTLDPTICSAFYNEGVVAYQAQDLDRAAALFQNAIECDPSYAKAHYSVGILYFERHELQNAAESFAQAVRYEPANENARFDYGVTLATLYREGVQDLSLLDQAIEQFENAPSMPHAQQNIDALRAIRELS